VLDADSTDPEAARRRRQDAEEVIGATALAAPLRILVAVPALEALRFLRPSALARAFSTAAEDLVTLGCLSPRDALTRIASDHDAPHAAIELTRTLDAHDITALRAEQPLRDLLTFLNELRNTSVAAAGLAGSSP
jgi:hypothetical protein